MSDMVSIERLQEEIIKRKKIEEKYYADLELFQTIKKEAPQAIIETGRQLFWHSGVRNIKRYLKQSMQYRVLKHKIKKKPIEFWQPVFNAEYYAKKNPDVKALCGDDIGRITKHFLTMGIFEGRETTETFNIHVYIMNNYDLLKMYGFDIAKYYLHFLEYGINENRKCV